MDNTIRKNPESEIRKNPLRARYMNLAPKSRRQFRADYMDAFEINDRPFQHRVSGRTKLSKEEVKWVNAWSFKPKKK